MSNANESESESESEDESETRGWLDRVAKGGFHAKFSGGGDGAICVGREKRTMGQTRGVF
jgi:hypothetical protein